MYTIDYTKAYNVSSTVVEGIYFNENDNTVVIDIQDRLYKYNNVTAADVGALAIGTNGSVGTYYNTVFKKVHGPAEYIGEFDDYEFYAVAATKNNQTATTPKGLEVNDVNTVVHASGLYVGAYADSAVAPHVTAAADNSWSFPPTKEYSLSSSFETDTNDDADATIEYSLNLPEAEAVSTGVDADVSVRVHFTLGDSDRKYKFDAKSTDVAEAIDELNEYISVFNAKGKVTKVVVKFD